MSTLHIISRSPFSSSDLKSCIRIIDSRDGILLCGNATYAVNSLVSFYEILSSIAHINKIFLLEEDLRSRMIECPSWAESILYHRFVKICIDYEKVNSWL